MASSKTPSRAMTSREIVHALLAALSPMLDGQMFRVSNGEEPPLQGISDHVTVTWASVPSDAPEIDALNAKASVMLAIDAPEWSQNRVDRARIGQIPVSSVKVRSFRGRSSFRAKTGTPEQIIAYVAEWFRKATSTSSANMAHSGHAGSRRPVRIGGLVRVVLPSGYLGVYTDARATPEETMRYGVLVAVRFPDGWREHSIGHWRPASEWDQQAYERAPMHVAPPSSANSALPSYVSTELLTEYPGAPPAMLEDCYRKKRAKTPKPKVPDAYAECFDEIGTYMRGNRAGRPRGWREPRAPIPVSPQMVAWMNDYMQSLAKPGERAQFRFGMSKRGHLTYARRMWKGQGHGSAPRAEVERDLKGWYNVVVQELVDLAMARTAQAGVSA